MAEGTGHDFSKLTLDIAERTQKAVGHSRLGSLLVRTFTGSSSPVYLQLDWQSRGVHSTIKNTVRVDGDPHAGRLARNWNRAAVMAVNDEEIEELGREVGKPGDYSTAVAYVADGVVRVGTHPDRSGSVLSPLDQKHLGVAMRLGKSSLEAACGLWIPEDKKFIGAESVSIVTPRMDVDYLPRTMHGIALV